LDFSEVILNIGEPVKVGTKVAMDLIKNNDFVPRRSVEYEH